MTFERFVATWAVSLKTRRNQRAGQWLMNFLTEVRPDLYKRIVEVSNAVVFKDPHFEPIGPYIDPFYNDAVIPATLTWLGENWNTEA